jgi:hypothetical protein
MRLPVELHIKMAVVPLITAVPSITLDKKVGFNKHSTSSFKPLKIV